MSRDLRRARRRLGRLLCYCGPGEAALVVAFPATPLPWTVPVAGMTHGAVPHDVHASREGQRLRHQGTDARRAAGPRLPEAR